MLFFQGLGRRSRHNRALCPETARALARPRDAGKCFMQIGRERFHWEEGHAVVFDDTHPHEVWNDTDEEPIGLLVDVVRPMRWPGRFAWRTVRALLRASPFVRDGWRNQRDWEERIAARQ